MDSSALKIGFAGTPEFAARHLAALLQAGHQIKAVYTQPDRPAGRGKQAQASPVKTLALANGLPVFQPDSLKSKQAQNTLADLDLDVLVVVAYGLILPAEILSIPRFGCINVHASLLPRWRGAAPIERAILAGDRESGVCIMQMDAGLDTGDILLCKRTPVSEEDNSESLTERLLALGQEALLEVLIQIQQGTLHPQKQDDSLSTYAAKLDKADSRIDWDKPAAVIHRQINALFPRAPAFSQYDNQRIRFIQARVLDETACKTPGSILQVDKQGLKVCCADKCLLVTKIQLPGKAALELGSFLNGRADFFKPGTRFTIQD